MVIMIQFLNQENVASETRGIKIATIQQHFSFLSQSKVICKSCVQTVITSIILIRLDIFNLTVRGKMKFQTKIQHQNQGWQMSPEK